MKSSVPQRLSPQYYAEHPRRKDPGSGELQVQRGIIRKAALCVLCRHRHKTHSTGHETRLNRTFGARFGDDLYGKEELVAEMGAAFLCALAGIANEHTERNTMAYIQNWISELQEDNRLIVHAAANAQKAVDLIIGTSFEEERETAAESGEAGSSFSPQPGVLAA